MKKLLLSVVFLSVLLCSLFGYDSVANPSQQTAIDINPASLSFFNNSTITFMRNWDYENDFNWSKDKALSFNMGNIGYSIKWGNSTSQTLSSSSKMFQNFYLGSSYDWRGSSFKKGNFNESLLYRPTDFVSIGAKVSDVFDRKNHSANVGIAVRPIFMQGKIWDRLTIQADTNYKEGSIAKPTIGMNSEFLNGVHLNGGYNLETKSVSLGFAIDFGNIKIGQNSITNSDNSAGNFYISSSQKRSRSIIDNFPSSRPTYYNYKLSGKILDANPELKIGFATIKIGGGATMESIKKQLNLLSKDKKLKGIILQSGTISTNMANMQELIKAFNKFKKHGKRVIAYYDYLPRGNYTFAAAVADEIYLNPSGEVDLGGLSVKSPYIKNLLDKIGVDVQNFRSHKYKTAGNMFAETEMTDAEREVYNSLLDNLYKNICDIIETGRKEKLKNNIKDIINQKPFFTPQEALDLGLIDGVIYKDELREKLNENSKKAIIKGNLFVDKLRTDWSDKTKDKIAIIYAIGNIHMGKGEYAKSIGATSIADAIRRARKDKSVKGIILRVNSGGGSALASDIIAREVELCNTGKDKKPIIASMGGVAASGGYFISAYADKIIAEPSTITGSIGVIGMIPQFKKLYDKIGVNWSEVKRGKYAGYPPTNRAMTNQEKEFISKSIEHTYWDFVGSVAKGRKMDKNAVHKIAQGRVWAGTQGLEIGLVDKLGGLDTAKEEMKKLAHLKHDIKLVEYKGREINMLSKYIGNKAKAKVMSSFPTEMQTLYHLFEKFSLYKQEKVLMLSPIEIDFTE